MVQRHAEEHLILEFRDGVKLYVPSSKIDLVQKYIGGKTEPELSKIGSSSWGKRKQKVEEAVLDLASDMIELQAITGGSARDCQSSGFRLAGGIRGFIPVSGNPRPAHLAGRDQG